MAAEERSKAFYERAVKRLPGGVNSPVRAYQAVGRTPRFIQSAKGAHITDVDGNEMIDYVCSWGPGILGHANPKVVEKVRTGSVHGSQPSGKFRNRGNDECNPCCQRIYPKR